VILAWYFGRNANRMQASARRASMSMQHGVSAKKGLTGPA
jgi:hypothetical protein